MDQAIENIFKEIDGSDSMNYSWFCRKDEVRHTGIIIALDGAQQFILDYGADLKHKDTRKSIKKEAPSVILSSSSSSSQAKQIIGAVPLKGKVNLYPFSGSGIKVNRTLSSLPLQKNEDKDKAKKLLKLISEIDIGDYKLMHNNCRSYVVVVATCLKTLAGISDNDWNAFEATMQKILQEDQVKFSELTRTILNHFRKKKGFTSSKR